MLFAKNYQNLDTVYFQCIIIGLHSFQQQSTLSHIQNLSQDGFCVFLVPMDIHPENLSKSIDNFFGHLIGIQETGLHCRFSWIQDDDNNSDSAQNVINLSHSHVPSHTSF